MRVNCSCNKRTRPRDWIALRRIKWSRPCTKIPKWIKKPAIERDDPSFVSMRSRRLRLAEHVSQKQFRSGFEKVPAVLISYIRIYYFLFLERILILHTSFNENRCKRILEIDIFGLNRINKIWKQKFFCSRNRYFLN